MLEKKRGSKYSRNKTLAILMAVINGINSGALLAIPFVQIVPEVSKIGHSRSGGFVNFNQGEQILNRLFFTTAYAAYTVNVTGNVSGETLNYGNYQNVSHGGTATSTTVNSGGVQAVYSGGSAASTTVTSGGHQQVLSGGNATSATLNSGGQQIVVSGGNATSTTVNSGSFQYVNTGGTATSTIVNSGGEQFVNSATAISTTLNSGGGQVIYSGGNATSTKINSGGGQAVFNGGTATSTTVNSGGRLWIRSGGSATDATLVAGYVLIADTNATLSAISGGTAVTINGGIANNITLNSGASLGVLTGNSAISTTVNSGGSQNVSSGGSATSTTINFGGVQTVLSGGVVTSTTVNGGGQQNIQSGGMAFVTTIQSGGTQSIASGGTASGSIIYSGAVQQIATGAITSNTQIIGNQSIDSGGTDNGSTIDAGGTQTISVGATANHALISGTQIVDGTANLSTIASGGTQTVTGNSLSTTIQSGGLQTILTGGTATNTTANASATINLANGAVLAGTTNLNQAVINLIDSFGTYSIAGLNITSGSRINLANARTVGNKLTIQQLNGAANFVINTDLAHNQADHITINNATANAQNTLQVSYDPGLSTSKNITGIAEFATVPNGTTFTALPTESGAYQYTPTLAVSADGTTWSVNALVSDNDTSSLKPSETMHTASDMIAGNLTLWRVETNSLEKRMGELRNSQGQEGMWTRIYRGKQAMKESDGRNTTQQYNAIQGGYDTKHRVKNGNWYTGYTVGYLSAKNNMERGSGDASSLSVGAYGSWLADDGHYLDIIAKQSKINNSYTNYLNNTANTKVNGDYGNWGSSLSMEYGYRKQLSNNWYLEPQVELTLGRISAANYTTSDNTAVDNHCLNSTVGRMGFAIGRKQQQNTFYAKLSVVREFSANTQVTMSNGGLTPISLGQNFKETWLEYAIGMTTAFNKHTNGYLEIEKTTGDKAKTPWLVNIGIRRSF